VVARWLWSVTDRWTVSGREGVVIAGDRKGGHPVFGEACFVSSGAVLIDATVGGVEMLGAGKPPPYWAGLYLLGVSLDDVPEGSVVVADDDDSGSTTPEFAARSGWTDTPAAQAHVVAMTMHGDDSAEPSATWRSKRMWWPGGILMS
jgi:hypothetical protein